MRFPLAALALAGLTFAASAQTTARLDSATTASSAATSALPAAPPKLPNDVKPKRLTILPIPVIFYQAETGLGYGLGGLLSGRFSDDTLTRPSNIRAQYWQTQKKQSLIQLVHTVYTPGEKFYLNGEISAYDQLLYYYGIGPKSQSIDESETAYKLFIINQRIQKAIAPKVFFGAQYRFTGIRDIEIPTGTVDAQGTNVNVFLRDPRVTPREREDTHVSGLGPVFTYDTRDVPLAAFRGNLVDASVMFNGSGLGSDYRFVRYQARCPPLPAGVF
ncbi:hypothetical protein ACFQT0_25765 [Hymenobacter humi]|uniref:Bacterial surface antigen (D15) domain-containing protein n=1 Tax=Hymenobacter humi TaxID=1411620 RepID=A0ABW2UAJ0_9BACT